MATNLSTNRSENSPQRARIDFGDSGANDSFGSGGRSVGGRKKRTSAQNIVEKKRQSRAEEPSVIHYNRHGLAHMRTHVFFNSSSEGISGTHADSTHLIINKPS